MNIFLTDFFPKNLLYHYIFYFLQYKITKHGRWIIHTAQPYSLHNTELEVKQKYHGKMHNYNYI